MKKAAIMLLFWSTCHFAFTQVFTSKVTVDLDHSDLTEITNGLKVTGNMEATTITTGTLQASGNVNISGEVITNGDIHTNSRIYFGGGDNSSFIQHIEGYVPKGQTRPFYVNVTPNGYINAKVSIGGRVSSSNFSIEKAAFGYMWGSGYISDRLIYSQGHVSMQVFFDQLWRLRVEVTNTDTSNDMIFSGTITVSQTGWGW